MDGVDVRERARVAAEPAQRGHVVHRAGTVGRPAECGHPGASRQVAGELGRVDDALGEVDGNLAHGGPAVGGGQHPRGDVGIVVEARDQHLVARAEAAAEDPRGVHRQRRHVGAEHDLVRLGAEERGGLCPG